MNSVSTPRVCYTAAGILIANSKVLLLRHKKLGIWLCPGGHIDEDELPHQAAEREFLEETGIQVHAVDYSTQVLSSDQGYVPSPILSHVHWVCRENYAARMADGTEYKKHAQWQRGCEQHLSLLYIVQPLSDLTVQLNESESTASGWFTELEVQTLPTEQNIREEVQYAFKHIQKHLVQ